MMISIKYNLSKKTDMPIRVDQWLLLMQQPIGQQ